MSTFQILIGDVQLGQRPELLEVALQPFGEGIAFVTDQNQTAVVSQSSTIRVDWLRWVRETLGNLTTVAEYTVYKTLLDGSGNVVFPRQRLPPTPINDTFRFFTVRISPESGEFYVNIEGVVVAQGARDPDSGIYELEACVPDGRCYNSALTVFGIGQPPVPIFAGDDGERV